jgi:hypothetical protein
VVRAPLDTSPKRRHPDDLFPGPSIRDFNFTVYALNDAGIDAEVRGLGKGETAVRVLDRYSRTVPLIQVPVAARSASGCMRESHECVLSIRVAVTTYLRRRTSSTMRRTKKTTVPST